jgi:hypothetical protein
MTTTECALCHNHQPVEDFLILTSKSPSGLHTTYYNHPNCAACRAMLESFGIPQKAPW